MTACPIFPKSLRMPVFGVVAVMLVMVALLLAARCSNEKYVQEQDIEIVKINADGTDAWTKTIDYGNDEEMREIIQMDDGSFIIAGGSSPKRGCNSHGTPDPLCYIPNPRISQLIGLSSSGEILWLRNYSFNGDGGMISVFRNPDRSLDAVTKNGELWHLNPDGAIISNRPVNISQIYSGVKTDDGGYVIVPDGDLLNTSGSNITRFDSEGTFF
jgi:hypothetical protein